MARYEAKVGISFSPFAGAVLVGVLPPDGGLYFAVKPDRCSQRMLTGGFETLDDTRGFRSWKSI